MHVFVFVLEREVSKYISVAPNRAINYKYAHFDICKRKISPFTLTHAHVSTHIYVRERALVHTHAHSHTHTPISLRDNETLMAAVGAVRFVY